MDVESIKKSFYLNPIAQLYLIAKQLVKVLIAGRGFGKSFINGIVIITKVATLPRSRGIFLGLTYTQILSNTLMPMKAAWEWFGYYENIHYVIGKRPPSHFKKPYQSPDRYQNVITFWNGTTVILGSFDRPQLLRGGSNDWVIVDEALLINHEKYTQIVTPSLRGSHPIFKGKPGHKSENFTSSMPYGNMGAWLLEYQERSRQNPKDYYYIEGTSWHNRVVLGDDTLRRWKRDMPTIQYLIEVMNKRIKQFGSLFYPAIQDKHFYSDSYQYDYIDSLIDKEGFDLAGKRDSRWDKDCDPKKALNLSFDFGAFNSLTIDQEIKDRNQVTEVRFTNFMYVSHPDIIDDLVDNFDGYYKYHENKVLYLWGDKSGNKREANSKLTYFQQIQKRLESKPKRWRVIRKDIGDIDHLERHRFINIILREEDPRLPRIRINQNNCKDLRIALESAGMKVTGKKDKSSENPKSGVKPEQSTHGTDAFDYRLYHAYRRLETASKIYLPASTLKATFGAN